MDDMKKKVRRLYIEKLADYTVSFCRWGYGHWKVYKLYQRSLISKQEAVSYAPRKRAQLEVLADLLDRDLYHDLNRWANTQAFARHLQMHINAQVRKYEENEDALRYVQLIDQL